MEHIISKMLHSLTRMEEELDPGFIKVVLNLVIFKLMLKIIQ